MSRLLDTVPEDRRDIARAALASAFGERHHGWMVTVASERSSTAWTPETVRISCASRRGAARCARIIPACARQRTLVLRRRLHADADAGVRSWISSPARSPTIRDPRTRARSGLRSRRQATPVFPHLMDYVAALVACSRVAVRRARRAVRSALRSFWMGVVRQDASSCVSSHNDPNPRNIIFDGERLCWSTGKPYRNDPPPTSPSSRTIRCPPRVTGCAAARVAWPRSIVFCERDCCWCGC